MNELLVIQSKIYELRGQKIMFDYDLAAMYGVETRVLNQAVKRNITRFPEDFMFKLTIEEWDRMSSQFVMTSPYKRPKASLPYAFTEHGVVMLSSVLRITQLEKDFNELKQDLEDIFADYNDINEDTRAQLAAINTTLVELQAPKRNILNRRVGFNIDSDSAI